MVETNNTPEEEITEEPTEEVETPAEEPSQGDEEPQKPETPAPEPDKEVFELFKSVKDEVGEKRFDGLMSAWQRDRKELLNLKDNPPEPQPAQAPDKVKGDEEWLNILDTQLEQRRAAREQREEQKAMQEVESAVKDFPELKADEVIDAVIKYSDDPKNAISAHTAARILTELRMATSAKELLSKEDQRRKIEASKIGGKSGFEQKSGIRPYDPAKDRGKSYLDLAKEGLEELQS